MDSETATLKLKRGQRLDNAKKLVVIGKLVDYLSQGYYNSYQLAKMTGLSHKTINIYRPLADKLITDRILNRNNIRNLQISRTYNIIEQLMLDLKTCTTIKEKTLIYNQIAKFSQHLALITGLNVETHVNIDHQQLVIVRANNNKKPIISLNETQDQDKQTIEAEMITVKDQPEENIKQGHTVK